MNRSVFECRDMVAGEEPAVLELVMRGFDEFVRPDFSDEGVDTFVEAARGFVLDHPPGHVVTVATERGELLGMIDLRDGSHVCLFFVALEHLGRGVGRALFEEAIARSDDFGVTAATVDSSPWAVPVYERLGFAATGPESELHGIRFVPMTCQLQARDCSGRFGVQHREGEGAYEEQ